MTPLDELRARFTLDQSVIFPRMEDADFAPLGLQRIPSSYRTIKELFGNSRLASDSSRFWIASIHDQNPNFSIIDLREMLSERLVAFSKRTNENWRPVVNGSGKPISYLNLTAKNIIPLFNNSEYDYWLCWNKERTVNGEPEVIYFDFGMQILLRKFCSLVTVYEMLSDGRLVEPLSKDKEGKIMLTCFEPW